MSEFRRQTVQVSVGELMLGSDYPIRIQSMTTTNTMDTQATIDQSVRMIEAGCELVRITAPSQREAKNLENIKKGLRDLGYSTPLVADIHYTPNAAEIAARIVEKVRINPGNYVDKKSFAVLEYDDASYQAELDRIRTRFTPLVRICKEYGTAMRIGTNHGSLSDRIVNRYGDNPLGMVESALEFLRVCEDEGYRNVVVSMKSSNPIVMIEAYRTFAIRCAEVGLPPYPLHLGVTEAGDGADGRVKSAIGIGTLVDEGLGDTIRVSLTEEPEAEVPVARLLAERVAQQAPTQQVSYKKRTTTPVANIGGDQLPRVVVCLDRTHVSAPADLAAFDHHYHVATDKWHSGDQPAEYFYVGQSPLQFSSPAGTRQWVDVSVWQTLADKLYNVPVFTPEEFRAIPDRHAAMNVVRCTPETVDAISNLHDHTLVLWIVSDATAYSSRMRACFQRLDELGCTAPVILGRTMTQSTTPLSEADIVHTATDLGAVLIDGSGNGVAIDVHSQLAYSVLQATRMRMTKTEYISCPSCGRTLFDLQETTALIRSKTEHLKGVKIGIMGCIVNGPGEMADADYGYVGSGPEKITLYRGQEIIKRAVPTSQALDELIALMKEDGRWVEPPTERS
ncbi:MAG: (E)-4-hydroxy-3-methylbut-2-enyl-diphosphate synthase [Bradyrhizobiaceae bacterium]|nr:(E)-4-hydroxy-3-methylbut-2-enyl-diphosphate synthase [Bradyrhizobiaceae bacterium]